MDEKKLEEKKEKTPAKIEKKPSQVESEDSEQEEKPVKVEKKLEKMETAEKAPEKVVEKVPEKVAEKVVQKEKQKKVESSSDDSDSSEEEKPQAKKSAPKADSKPEPKPVVQGESKKEGAKKEEPASAPKVVKKKVESSSSGDSSDSSSSGSSSSDSSDDSSDSEEKRRLAKKKEEQKKNDPEDLKKKESEDPKKKETEEQKKTETDDQKKKEIEEQRRKEYEEQKKKAAAKQKKTKLEGQTEAVDAESFLTDLLTVLKDKSDNYYALAQQSQGLEQLSCVQVCQTLIKESEEIKIEICRQILDQNSKARYVFASIFGQACQWQDRSISPFIIGYIPVFIWTYLFQTILSSDKPDEVDKDIFEKCLIEIYMLQLRNVESQPVGVIPSLKKPSIYHTGYVNAVETTRETLKENLSYFDKLNISNRANIFQGLLSLFRDYVSKIESPFLTIFCLATERLLSVGTPFSKETRVIRQNSQYESLGIGRLLNLEEFPKVSLSDSHLNTILNVLVFCFHANNNASEVAKRTAEQLHDRACFDLMTSVIPASQIILKTF